MPTGVVYGSVSLPGAQGQALLDSAVNELVKSVADPNAKVLWSLRYTQLGRESDIGDVAQTVESKLKNIICFPPPSIDLAFDDATIAHVKAAWKAVMGDNVDDEFMNFEDREGAYDEE